MNKTSISINRETRNKIARLGKKGQTFDEIIRELLAKWENVN